MFGYKFIKEEEIENLKQELKEANFVIDEKTKQISELIAKIDEQDKIIANLTKPSNVNNESKEEKPIKKVRRKYTKKNPKKEE